MENAAREQLVAAFEREHIVCTENGALAPLTTFHIGGPARLLCRPQSVEALQSVLRACGEAQTRWYCLGKGSNTLFADEGFDGVVILLGPGLDTVLRRGEEMEVQAGASLALVCRTAQKEGLSGLEFAYGIPGSAGGAVYMNAGAYGGEMKDVVAEVDCLDRAGELHTVSAQDCQFSYRHSAFQESGWVVVRVRYRLHADAPAAIAARMEDYMGRRREKQPLELPSAGSTFKRPQGAYAAALIESCGLKGFSVGGAQVSKKHCGFVVNAGGATCRDVLTLCDEVCRVVCEKTGYSLEKEVRVVQ